MSETKETTPKPGTGIDSEGGSWIRHPDGRLTPNIEDGGEPAPATDSAEAGSSAAVQDPAPDETPPPSRRSRKDT